MVRKLLRLDVIALNYHVVSDEDLAHVKLYTYKNVRQFEDDVAFARERAVGYADLANHRLRGTALPPTPFLFTFDDGFSECFHVVRPVLKKHGVDGVFFVVGEFIDDRTPFRETTVSLCISEIERMALDRAGAVLATLRSGLSSNANGNGGTARGEVRRELILRLLSAAERGDEELECVCRLLGVDTARYRSGRRIFMRSEELRTLSAEGFTVGAHGLTHRKLQTMQREQIEREIVGSCLAVRDITGQRFVPFAFPYGGRGLDRAFLADLLARHPFIQLLFDSGRPTRRAPFLVPRIGADPGALFAGFAR